MKVTAFLRKTAAKNNVTDLAKVYFRVRDCGGTDIKAASGLSINPNHWSAEKQGYKPRILLVSEEKRLAFDKAVQEITHLITKEYYRGADGAWLKGLIEEYHHPNLNSRAGNGSETYSLTCQIRRYIEETPLAQDSIAHHLGNIDKISRYERFQREVMHRRGFRLYVDTMTEEELRELRIWLTCEHSYGALYPGFYRDVPPSKWAKIRSENSVSGYFYRIRTVVKWCIRKGLTRNNPFDRYQIAPQMYGDPFYLTIEERDRIYYADLSRLHPANALYRDIFMFQCLVGCRVSDLAKLTRASLVDGCIEYIPQKTKGVHANTVRVPLNRKALDILERYRGGSGAEDCVAHVDSGLHGASEPASQGCGALGIEGLHGTSGLHGASQKFQDCGTQDSQEPLLPRFCPFTYNSKIKKILKYVGIDRKILTLDPKTRQEVIRPLYEVITTHTARKTFIGNLYKQVKDPNLIASMSGHTEGSRAFARYRTIDDEMKKELVDLLG